MDPKQAMIVTITYAAAQTVDAAGMLDDSKTSPLPCGSLTQMGALEVVDPQCWSASEPVVHVYDHEKRLEALLYILRKYPGFEPYMLPDPFCKTSSKRVWEVQLMLLRREARHDVHPNMPEMNMLDNPDVLHAKKEKGKEGEERRHRRRRRKDKEGEDIFTTNLESLV